MFWILIFFIDMSNEKTGELFFKSGERPEIIPMENNLPKYATEQQDLHDLS